MAPVARDEQALREFSERMSAALTAAGFPRMPARALMALTISESDGLTAADLAEQLAVSAGAISGAVRYLQTLGMVRRVSQPGTRRDIYELPQHNPWYTASMRTSTMYDAFLALAPTGIAAAGGAESLVGSRLVDLSDFLTFVKRRLPELLDEWTELRRAEAGGDG